MKPKQGLVFHVFRGHIMGIPANYRDAGYKCKVPLLPKVSILPLTKEQLALQKCVGGSAKRCAPTQVRPTKLDQQNWGSALSGDRLAKEESLDVEVCLLTMGLELRAPIKMVDGGQMEPRSVPITASDKEDPRRSVGESIPLNLSLLSNNL